MGESSHKRTAPAPILLSMDAGIENPKKPKGAGPHPEISDGGWGKWGKLEIFCQNKVTDEITKKKKISFAQWGLILMFEGCNYTGEPVCRRYA